MIIWSLTLAGMEGSGLNSLMMGIQAPTLFHVSLLPPAMGEEIGRVVSDVRVVQCCVQDELRKYRPRSSVHKPKPQGLPTPKSKTLDSKPQSPKTPQNQLLSGLSRERPRDGPSSEAEKVASRIVPDCAGQVQGYPCRKP